MKMGLIEDGVGLNGIECIKGREPTGNINATNENERGGDDRNEISIFVQLSDIIFHLNTMQSSWIANLVLICVVGESVEEWTSSTNEPPPTPTTTTTTNNHQQPPTTTNNHQQPPTTTNSYNSSPYWLCFHKLAIWTNEQHSTTRLHTPNTTAGITNTMSSIYLIRLY